MSRWKKVTLIVPALSLTVIESVKSLSQWSWFRVKRLQGEKEVKKNRIPYLCLLSSWVFCLASCHSLSTVTSPEYGRFSFPVDPSVYPSHSLGLIVGKYVLETLSVAALALSPPAPVLWLQLVELGWISSAEVNATGVPREPRVECEPCRDVWEPAERVAGRLTLHRDTLGSREPQ